MGTTYSPATVEQTSLMKDSYELLWVDKTHEAVLLDCSHCCGLAHADLGDRAETVKGSELANGDNILLLRTQVSVYVDALLLDVDGQLGDNVWHMEYVDWPGICISSAAPACLPRLWQGT